MTILYFTSTGNSLQIAKRTGGALLSIPQMIKENKYHFEDDSIGLITPVYGFGLPKIVKRFLKKASFKSQYTFAVSTYGNEAGAVLFNLAKLAEKSDIKFDYMAQILMVDNYLPMFEVNKQIAKLPEKKTKENIVKVVEEIHSKKTNTPDSSFLKRAATVFVSGINWYYHNDKMAQDFIVNDQCTSCRICVKVCPVGNITVSDKVQFSDHCEVCYSCVHNCPSNAIHLKNERSTTRYRNEDVTLKEIQSANSQI